MRYIFSLDPRCHVDGSNLKGLGWLSVRDRVKFFRLVHVFKVSKGLSPSYLSDGFVNVNQVHSHNTRGSVSDFHVSDRALTSLQRDTFRFKGKMEWNSLPRDLKKVTGLNTFKTKLRSYFTEQY